MYFMLINIKHTYVFVLNMNTQGPIKTRVDGAAILGPTDLPSQGGLLDTCRNFVKCKPNCKKLTKFDLIRQNGTKMSTH